MVYLPFRDNFDFMHRAFWQMGHLREPFAIHNTDMWTQNLPPISEAHVLTSTEMIGAFAGRLGHLDGLWLNLTAIPAITVLVGTCAVGLTGQFLGARPLATAMLLLGFAGASLVGGDVLRTIGLFGLPRMSEGKCAMVFAGIPIAFLYFVRFSRTPNQRHWLLLAMVGAAFVGWSSSGILLAPVLFLLVAIARFRAGRRTGVLLLISGFYPVLCFALAKLGPVPKLKDTSVWVNDWPANWRDNIGLIARGQLNLWLALSILSVGVLVFCRRKDLWLSLVPILGILLLFNPILGPVVMKIVPPGVYWRLGYLMCAPLGVGFCFAAVEKGRGWRQVIGPAIGISVLALGLPLAVPGSEDNAYGMQVVYGSPLHYKWWAEDVGVANALRHRLTESRLLAPERLSCILSLLDPSLKFDSVRPSETLHFFKNSDQSITEGRACLQAQLFLEGSTQDSDGLRQRVSSGLHQLVLPKTRLEAVLGVFKAKTIRISVEELGFGYVLVRIKDEASEDILDKQST